MKTNQKQSNTLSDWKHGKLGDFLLKMEGGGTPSKERAAFWDGSIPWASVKDIVTHNPNGTQDYITEDGLQNSSSRIVKKGTIITPTRMALGHAVIFNVDVAINQDLKALYPKVELNNDFLLHWFAAKKTFIQRLGSGSTVSGIQEGELKAVKFNLPPLPEQNRIVSVLETWDKGIEGVEKKIGTKKQLKLVLRKQLITGKKRLAGYSKKWGTEELGNLLDYQQPTKFIVESTDYRNEYKTPVLTANKGFILGYTNETNGIYTNPPVIIFDDFTTDTKFVDFSFKVKSSAIKILTAKSSQVNINFIFERMKLIPHVIGEHKRHYLSEYQYVTIDIPDIDEQNAIADILTKADQEIQLLEKKLLILKDQKKYLLNNLITGAIRTPETLTVNPK